MEVLCTLCKLTSHSIVAAAASTAATVVGVVVVVHQISLKNTGDRIYLLPYINKATSVVPLTEQSSLLARLCISALPPPVGVRIRASL